MGSDTEKVTFWKTAKMSLEEGSRPKVYGYNFLTELQPDVLHLHGLFLSPGIFHYLCTFVAINSTLKIVQYFEHFFILVMFIFLSSNPSSWEIFKTCICIFVFLQCVLLSAFIHFQLLCQRTCDDWSPSRDTMKQHWVYLLVFFFVNLSLLE